MKRFIVVLLALACLCGVFLVSCDDEDGIPDGMKYANDKSKVGYSLFVPDAWVIDTATDRVTLAHASSSDPTSVNVQRLSYTSLDKWWADTKSSLERSFTLKSADGKVIRAVEYEVVGQDAVVGGQNAKKYVATGVWGENGYYTFDIYGVLKGDSVYSIVFAFPCTKRDGTSYTKDYHADAVKAIIDEFKFEDGELSPITEPSYEVDGTPEGMKCASNPEILDYALFVPSEFTVENTLSGTDTVSNVASAYLYSGPKSINVNVMQWNWSEASYEEWQAEFSNQVLNSFVSSDIESSALQKLKIDDLDAVRLDFTASLDSGSFNYQTYAVFARGSVHVITFTIRGSDSYENYQADIDKIIGSFKFI